MEKTITLDNGFECAVDDVVLDDFELVEYLGELDEIQNEDGEQLRAGRLVSLCLTKLLGKKQYSALKNHVRSKGGQVPMKAFENILEDIFVKMGEEGKN